MKKTLFAKTILKRSLILLTAFLAVSAFNSCSDEDDEPEVNNKENTNVSSTYGVIIGKVVDSSTNKGISKAFVEIFPGEVYQYSSTSGDFKFNDLAPDEYTVVAVADGYETTSINVNISAGKATNCTIYMTRESNPQPDPQPQPTEDYSSAEISCDLPDVEIELVSCKRKGSNVELTYTMTNTDMLRNQGVTIGNVNAFTNHTHIADNLGNQYPRDQVKISLAGKDFGFGNDIEGTLLGGVPSKVVVTVKAVDTSAKMMHYYIYTSTAKPGGVNYTSDIILKNVTIY